MAEQAAEVLDTGNQEEPSMEEILASIRKIITEEEEDPATAEGAAAPAEDDVIDLTEGQLISAVEEQPVATITEAIINTPEIPNEPIAITPAPEPIAIAPVVAEPISIVAESIIVEPEPAPIAAAVAPSAAPIIVPEIAEEPKAGSATPVIEAEVKTPSITAQDNEPDTDLTDILEEPALLSEKSAEVAGKAFHDLALKINLLGNKENTLEGVVKELLRPMLKEWLDENLARIVLKMVRKEIDKITQ